MATPFADTPKWFDTNYYLDQKVAQMQLADPKGNWDRAAVIKNFADNGFDNAYDHYKLYGDIESLSPNPLFNNAEYLAAKAALNGSTWTVEMVAKDIADHGLTLMEHYLQFGGKYENLSPSSEFNQDKYFDAKLDMMQTAEPDKGWTLEKVKADFAAAGLSALEHYLTYGKVEGLDKYDYSVNGDPIPHPGNTKIVLTTGADVATKDATVAELKTTDRDDVISAISSTLTSKATLNAGDVIDGGAGVDTLKVDMQGNFGGFKDGSVKNVEKIVLDNAGGKTFNAKGIEKAELYTIDAADKGGLTLTNVDSAATDYSLTMEKGTFSVSIADAALAGKEDVVDVTLNGVGITKTDPRVTVEVKGTSSAGQVEGLNFTLVGENFVTLSQGQTSVAVKGAGSLDVVASGGLKSFDASAATGKIVADLKADVTTLKTVNGGSADDTIIVAGLAAGAVVDGGEGKDTLNFSTFASGDIIKNTITSVETFEFATLATADGGNRDLTVDMVNMSGLQTIKVGGANNFAGTDDFIVKNAGSNDLTLDISNKAASIQSFTFDGNSVLNVSLNGETGTQTAGAELTLLTASKATILNISNNSELAADVLTIKDIVAGSATAISIDTGDKGVTVSGSTVADNLASLETLTFKGDGAAVFAVSGSTTSKLNVVDAETLGGDLTLDLANLPTTTGVTVNMGNGGSLGLTGTTKADTFNLGSGNELVNLDPAAAKGAADLIVGFSDGDTVGVGVDISSSAGNFVSVAASAGATTIGKEKMYAFAKALTVDLSEVTDAQVKSYISKGTASGTSYVLLTDSDGDVGVFSITIGATPFAVGAVNLMGILDDVALSSLNHTDFVA